MGLQTAIESLRLSLAIYLSQINGKSPETNLREAINTSLVTTLSVTEVLEYEIDRLRTLDNLAFRGIIIFTTTKEVDDAIHG